MHLLYTESELHARDFCKVCRHAHDDVRVRCNNNNDTSGDDDVYHTCDNGIGDDVKHRGTDDDNVNDVASNNHNNRLIEHDDAPHYIDIDVDAITGDVNVDHSVLGNVNELGDDESNFFVDKLGDDEPDFYINKLGNDESNFHVNGIGNNGSNFYVNGLGDDESNFYVDNLGDDKSNFHVNGLNPSDDDVDDTLADDYNCRVMQWCL